jgi:hypothetical protein
MPTLNSNPDIVRVGDLLLRKIPFTLTVSGTGPSRRWVGCPELQHALANGMLYWPKQLRDLTYSDLNMLWVGTVINPTSVEGPCSFGLQPGRDGAWIKGVLLMEVR